MKALLGILLAVALGNDAAAHDHNLATFSIDEKGGVWLLKNDFTTSTMLESFHMADGPASSQEIKEAMVHYRKDHIAIEANAGQPVTLDQGGIKYGSHSSEVIFILKGFPWDWTSLSLDIPAFHENEKQSNRVRVEDAAGKYRAFLNAENGVETRFERVQIGVAQPPD